MLPKFFNRKNRRANTPASAPPPNRHPVIAGYRIGDEMGCGPLGKVYRAVHEATGALVVFRGFTQPQDADYARWESAKAQFDQLLSMHQRVPAHPNVQQIIGCGDEDGLFWVATEYFEGRTLENILATGGAQPLPWAREVLRQIGDAVDWSRKHGGLSHTDLNPYNILITENPNVGNGEFGVKVINFGLAHARNKFGSRYAAPEQMDGFEGDYLSDVYSVGVLLYEMLSGRPIFQAADPNTMAERVRGAKPATLHTQPAYVRQILASMLNKDPYLRYTSIGQAVADLQHQRPPAPVPVQNVPLAPDSAPSATNFGTPFPLAQPSAPKPSPVPSTSSQAPERVEDVHIGDRFSRLELDGDGMTQGAVVTSRASPIPVALQGYHLDEQDLVMIRWRIEQRRKESAERQRDAWGHIAYIARLCSPAIAIVALAMHAQSQIAAYTYVTVTGLTGAAELRSADGTSATSLHVGDKIHLSSSAGIAPSSTAFLIVTTGPGARILLDSRGVRLHLQQNSALEIREMDYHYAPVRRFGLRRGTVDAEVDPNHRGGAVFEIASGTLRTLAKGTQFGVITRTVSGSSSSALASRNVVVATSEGIVRVVRGESLQEVPAGHEIAAAVASDSKTEDTSLPTAYPMSDSARALLADSTKSMAGVRSPFGFAASLADLEEKILLPVTEVGGNIAHLPTFISDRRAQILAIGSMQALCTLIQTEISDRGAPVSINPATLEELGMKLKDRQRLLDQFQDARLVSYRALPDGGYEFLARARDSNHSLVRARNGVASLVGNDDTESLGDDERDTHKSSSGANVKPGSSGSGNGWNPVSNDRNG